MAAKNRARSQRKARRAAARRRPAGTAASAGPPDELEHPELYFNRELSLLAFQQRVLEQAKDEAVPLLERLRFLAICSTNMDEFFEVRVGGLRQAIEYGFAKTGPDGLTPRETQTRVAETARRLVDEQYRVLDESILPALAREGIRVLFRTDWDDDISKWSEEYFEHEVKPVLTPLGLDPSHPFPAVLNKSLNFIVHLEGEDAFGRSSRIAVVQAPRLLPRLIALPQSVTGMSHQFVTLSGVIHTNLGTLFPGMTTVDSTSFRVTRNSELWVDEEEVEDLLLALKGELPRRNFGAAVRLEVGRHCEPESARFLLDHFGLEEQDLFRVNGPVNLHRLAALHDLVDRPDLKYPPFVPSPGSSVVPGADLFERIRQGDILLHHPYESFNPVVELLQQAASDPQVLAIKMTLYRIGKGSPMADALLEAALNGKEVTAVVELRARFDEAANIDLAMRLQDAGAKVVYGVVGYKAHAKMLLIVRRDEDGMRRYVHLGTGNYHLGNTRTYTDFGLLTCDPAAGEDIHTIFQQLTGLGSATRLKVLLQSPFSMHARVLELIDAETKQAEAGREASIRVRVNALIEPSVIRALYRASQAGVEIALLVRGICCLKPGVPGVSERITVRSVVGRFLEHSRVFAFHNGGDRIVYASSADWMPRNFFRRVETAFPLQDEEIRSRVVEEGLKLYFEDNVTAWELQPDGDYVRLNPGDRPPFDAQQTLRDRLGKPAF